MRLMLLAGLTGLAACDLDGGGNTAPDRADHEERRGIDPPGTNPGGIDPRGTTPGNDARPGMDHDGAAATGDRVAGDNPPFQQAENASDIDVTAEIRRQVLDHPDLGVDADNVTITTAGGVVTVRGQVDSAQEKATIVQIARGVSGVTEVKDEIMVEAGTQ